MALITQEELASIARLSALSLTQEEEQKLIPQLSSIIEYASSLQKVAQTSAIMQHNRTPLLREDLVHQADNDAIIGQAPSSVDRYFQVPSILE